MSIRVDPAGGWYEEIFVDLMLQPLRDAGGGTPGIFMQGHNVSEDKRSEELRSAHNRVLELAIGDSPLEQTLRRLIKIVESTSRTEVLGSILLLDLDGKHLRHGAAPSLPTPYMEAIDGAEIGPCAGSCGTAAYSAAPVFVSDIAKDPLWAEYKVAHCPMGFAPAGRSRSLPGPQGARHLRHVSPRAARTDGARPGAGRPHHPDRGAGDRPRACAYRASRNRAKWPTPTISRPRPHSRPGSVPAP